MTALQGMAKLPSTRVTDGGHGGFAREAGGAGDGAVSGVDLGAPVGAEPIGDLAEHDRGADFALGDGVGCRHFAVAEEDEEPSPPRLDLLDQGLSGGMGDGSGDQTVEPAFGLGGIGGQGAVLELGSSFADLDRPAQMVADFRGGDRVAVVDGILHIAQDMGEADLRYLLTPLRWIRRAI
jgi:hypothetical protein